MQRSIRWLIDGVGLCALGGALLFTPAFSQSSAAPPVALTPAPVTLPAPGQALVHEFTTSTGAVCTGVATATSSDPHPVCGAEPMPVATPVTK